MTEYYGKYKLAPEEVTKVKTEYRTIQTPIPAPESLEVLERLLKYEPQSMEGQPPIVWDRAEGFQVYDGYGNKWLDLTAGVLVANSGHGNSEIIKAIQDMAGHGLLHNYCFPHEIRSKLTQKLSEMAPEGLDKVFLLTTGSEATENAIKLSRAYGRKEYDEKINIISFNNDFHGRTLGAQMIGGIPKLKEWIGEYPKGFYQMPFPDGYHEKDQSFDLFIKSIKETGLDPEREVAAVIPETYQGGGASFAPKEYMRKLAEWCKTNDVLLIFDEVQAGFGRTGKLFAFEHYGVKPDIICCGKGISSSLPLSAVISRSEIMDLFDSGQMTSTHTGNPVCSAAALANLNYLEKKRLVENSAKMGEILHKGLRSIMEQHPDKIGAIHGKGLLAGIHMIKDGKPDGDRAFVFTDRAIKSGLMLFSPVGVAGSTIKITPPLVINEEAIRETVQVIAEIMAELE